MSAPERDLVGYGAEPPRIGWPGGARLAISLVVNYEEGSERTLAAGDADQEPLTEWGAYPVPPKIRNLAMESMNEYGSRVGVWRILRILRPPFSPVHVLRVRRRVRTDPRGRAGGGRRRPRDLQSRLSLGRGLPAQRGRRAAAHSACNRVLGADDRQTARRLVLQVRAEREHSPPARRRGRLSTTPMPTTTMCPISSPLALCSISSSRTLRTRTTSSSGWVMGLLQPANSSRTCAIASTYCTRRQLTTPR